MKKLHVKARFLTEVLGAANNNPEIHDEFIASKAATKEDEKEEVEAIPVGEQIEKSMTVFPRNAEGKPIIWDYQIKGFFKEAASILRTLPDTKSKSVKAFKKYIDGRIFIKPRQIPIEIAERYADGSDTGNCQRPLRAETAQGPRVALANSEEIKAGATFEFDVVCLHKDDVPWVKEMLEYGEWKGLLQWRNSGRGAFEVVEITQE